MIEVNYCMRMALLSGETRRSSNASIGLSKRSILVHAKHSILARFATPLRLTHEDWMASLGTV